MRLLLITILFGFSLPLHGWAAEGPGVVEFPSRWGTVTFQHHRHQARTADCLACHHQGIEMGACRSCHGVLPTTPLSKDVLHKLCKNCHRDTRGPTECAGCHDPASADASAFQD